MNDYDDPIEPVSNAYNLPVVLAVLSLVVVLAGVVWVAWRACS